MNIANISALHHLVSQVVGRKGQEDAVADAFSVPAGTVSPVPAVNSVAQNTGSQQDASYDEAFAKMLVNLKSATQTAAESETTFVSKTSDSNIAANDSAVVTDADVGDAVSKFNSVQQQFMDYMNLTPAEQMREKLTGVSKDEYDAMSPQDKLAIDDKLQAALKEQQQTATADVNSKILAARLALV